jgi:hypothetical protein
MAKGLNLANDEGLKEALRPPSFLTWQTFPMN